MSEADRTWAQREARRGLGGVVHAVPRWLNHPVAIGRANYKPVQLVEAQRVGLRVPQTVITNEPRVAARLAARVGAVVYKPFYSWLTDDDGRSGMVYTVPVSEAELDDASIRLTAHLFQERVPKQYEIRLTVVDAHMFAVRIDVVSDHGKIDWRADHTNLIHSLVDLPERVARQVRLLMHRLGLRFAAIDLIVTPDDDYVFLEANPNGQWGWMEHEIGVPIAAAVADALTAGPGKSNAGKSGAVRASAVGMPGGVVAHE
jgi:glutathione synthase/RimK-type ligase-like ATP-grasp enzyme